MTRTCFLSAWIIVWLLFFVPNEHKAVRRREPKSREREKFPKFVERDRKRKFPFRGEGEGEGGKGIDFPKKKM